MAATAMDFDFENLHRYMSPVSPSIFPLLTGVLLSIGVFFTAWFFVYEVTITKETRRLRKELALSFVSAVFSGFGLMFLLLTFGIYV